MMVQLIAFLLMVAALVILVLQNLSPVMPLVVLGQSVGPLPLSLWLLGAIAIGILCTLVIYQLVPQKRAYRPMGKRLSDPVPPDPTNRFVDQPDGVASGSTQFQSPTSPPSQNPYDSDWENFRAPEQWDDWGQRQPARYPDQEPAARGTAESRRPSTDDAMRDIESGWGDDDYQPDSRRSSYGDPYGQEDGNPDIGWPRREPVNPQQQTYKDGWLYGNEADDEPAATNEPGAPQPDESEDVYDANYRVIIPPYDAKDG